MTLSIVWNIWKASFEVSACEAGERFRGWLCSRRKDARLFHGSSGRPLEKCHAIVKRFMLHCPKGARQCFQKLARSLDLTRKSLLCFVEIHFSCYSKLFRITNSTVYEPRCFHMRSGVKLILIEMDKHVQLKLSWLILYQTLSEIPVTKIY